MTRPPQPPRLPAVEARPGWEARWQLTLIEPAEEVPGYLESAEPAPKPRLNLVLSCTPTKAGNALEAAREFLEQTQPVVPGLEVTEPPSAILFADGHPGARATVSFWATPEVRLRQHHLFRIDDGQLTQAVVTSDDERPKAETDELIEDVLRFRP
jgi:hypothetical protein